MRTSRVLAFAAGLSILAAPLPFGSPLLPTAVAQPSTAPERWRGAVELPGMSLEFFVTLRRAADGSLSGTLDIPAQGLTGGQITDIERDGDALSFRFAPAGAPFPAAFKLTVDDAGEAKGTLEQAGQQFPVAMSRLSEGEQVKIGPDRPQNPKPPFPYDEREVEITSAVDGVPLAGTLTLPRGAAVGGAPAVVLLTGSGAQDRDETIFGHKPFWVIADHLTRAGIAVLRMDDRGVGGSGGDTTSATLETFAGDALSAVAYLRTLPEIDAKRVGLVGHSEGGLVAPIAAARSKDVAFLVLLAGTGVPGREVLVSQQAAILRAAGAPEEVIEQQQADQRAALDLVEQGADRQAVIDFVLASLAASGQQMPEAQARALAEQQAATLATPWFRSFLSTDPAESLRRVRVPVLALNGERDLQVLPKLNLPAIERALREGGATDVTIVELPGLNHLFQRSATGRLEEYGSIDETFNRAALDVMTRWILDRARAR